MKRIYKMAVIGEYNPCSPSHQTISLAIEHANKKLGSKVEETWIAPENIENSLFKDFTALWIAPGAPHKKIENTLMAIRCARENKIPCLGTCGGFQHMVIEYARHVLGYKDAQHAECDPHAPNLFISPLKCSLAGKEGKIQLRAGSKLAKMYNKSEAVERYSCHFGIHPVFASLFNHGVMHCVGADSKGEIRALEISTHPFFIGALFVPQMRSTFENPHPLIIAFLDRIINS